MKKFILLGVCFFMLTGCFSGRSPNSEFFMMKESLPTSIVSSKKISLQVEEISIPDLIYKPQIVLKDKDSLQVNVSEFHRWAEPLPDVLRQTLIDDMQLYLPNAFIQPVLYDDSVSAQYTLTVEVNHFIGTFDGVAVLDVWWRIQNKAGKTLFKEKTKLEKEMGDTYQDYVAVQSELMGELSKIISTKITK